MCNRIATGWTVTKTEYTNQNCTGRGTLMSTWTSKNATNGLLGSNPIYECDGVNSYAKIHISLVSDCSSSVTVYAGLAGCAVTGGGATQFEFFCNNTVAFVEFFRTANASLVNQTQSTNQPQMTTIQPQMTTNQPQMTTNQPQMTTNQPQMTTQPAATGIGLLTTLLNTLFPNSSLQNASESMSTTYIETSSSYVETSSSYVETSSTYIESTLAVHNVSQLMCSSNNYCEVWILPSGKCSLANTTAFRNYPAKIYGQLMSCQAGPLGGASTTTTTFMPTKSGSTRLQLAVTVIFTLFLAISWL